METQTINPQTAKALDDIVRRGHPALRGWYADQTSAYAEEVRVLRRRVALLEAELAVVHAAGPQSSSRTSSLFDEPNTPAVVAADRVATPATTATSAVEHGSTGGFAEAWNSEADELSFEERLAERAFFTQSEVDQASRSWLLTD